MDHKPLLQERPPAYSLEAGQGDYACGPHGYGAIPTAPPPPPYPYLVTGLPTHHPRVYNIHSRAVTRYPANSIVVVGGCPVCSLLCHWWGGAGVAGSDCPRAQLRAYVSEVSSHFDCRARVWLTN
ncbi:membrane protein BRI3 isoform X2 [Microcebus murinus]|uniref:membrane protein BRI3 isoform X2 n=1 Tax=Microcebus murinus TaxID=30608 RepID=UPI003F6D3DBF